MANDALHALGVTKSPEFECDQLLADAAATIAQELAVGIASLGYPVGMGMAPDAGACLAASKRIVEHFRGATRGALMAEGLAARLAELQPDDPRAACLTIADRVEPRYRAEGPRSYSCGGTVAKLWQAAWDGACIAFGGNPADHLGPPIDPATPPDAA